MTHILRLRHSVSSGASSNERFRCRKDEKSLGSESKSLERVRVALTTILTNGFECRRMLAFSEHVSLVHTADFVFYCHVASATKHGRYFTCQAVNACAYVCAPTEVCNLNTCVRCLEMCAFPHFKEFSHSTHARSHARSNEAYWL